MLNTLDPATYNAARYAVPVETIRRLSQKSRWHIPSRLIVNWIIVSGVIALYFRYVYVPGYWDGLTRPIASSEALAAKYSCNT